MKRKGIVLLLLVITLMITGCRKEKIALIENVEVYENQVNITDNTDEREKFSLSLNITVDDVIKTLSITNKDLGWCNPINMDYYSNIGYIDFSLNESLLPAFLPSATYDNISVIINTINNTVFAYEFSVISPKPLITGKEFLEFIQYEKMGDLLTETPTVRLEDGGLTEFVKFDYADCCLVIKTFDWNGEGVGWDESAFVDAVLISSSVLDTYGDEILNNNGMWDYSEFAPAPFSNEDFWDMQKVESDWYDNGIFSTYMEMAYPTDEWEYSASIYIDMDNNPYGYLGFEIYTHQCKATQQAYMYLVPITIASAPEVYAYDTISNSMCRVFSSDGEEYFVKKLLE